MKQSERTKIVERACKILTQDYKVVPTTTKPIIQDKYLEKVRKTVSHYKYKYGVDITKIMSLENIWKESNTGLKGVRKDKNKYRAQKTIKGRTYCIGFYDTPEEAHEAFKNFKVH